MDGWKGKNRFMTRNYKYRVHVQERTESQASGADSGLLLSSRGPAPAPRRRPPPRPPLAPATTGLGNEAGKASILSRRASSLSEIPRIPSERAKTDGSAPDSFIMLVVTRTTLSRA